MIPLICNTLNDKQRRRAEPWLPELGGEVERSRDGGVFCPDCGGGSHKSTQENTA